ncbi:MAG TPA: 2-amino-4-hydroxy-6-hydroxymethyldihydropteridine diphosphokinase [Armatimonadota bacterium]|jgi:dihydroneopterin aldolase/2-amino-4-hydroxy-6-hydroxymethyldihydropteridine diphosphokinase
MARVFVAVGSNLEPERHVPEGLRRLSARVPLVAISTFYRTEPEGRPEQPAFYNGVVEVATDLSPRELKFDVLREIERQTGRVRAADRYAARTLDLDLLLYGDQQVQEPDLVLPDPDLARRAFLAAPLAELAPELVVPGDGRTTAQIAAAAPGRLESLPEFTARLRKEIIHES